MTMRIATTLSFWFAALASTAPADAQRPPLDEAEIIRLLTTEGPAAWETGVHRSLGIGQTERSDALLVAMIDALEREVAWEIERRKGLGEVNVSGESSSRLARVLGSTGDPRVLPPLAWHAYNGAEALYGFGARAVPHLLGVALSPDALGDEAGNALWVLSSIVLSYGPGAYEDELAEAAALHLDGPPAGYQSAWTNPISIAAMTEAVALAGVLRAPDLLGRLEAIAQKTPDQIIARGYVTSVTAETSIRCAKAHLDGTQPPAVCDPQWWIPGSREPYG